MWRDLLDSADLDRLSVILGTLGNFAALLVVAAVVEKEVAVLNKLNLPSFPVGVSAVEVGFFDEDVYKKGNSVDGCKRCSLDSLLRR